MVKHCIKHDIFALFILSFHLFATFDTTTMLPGTACIYSPSASESPIWDWIPFFLFLFSEKMRALLARVKGGCVCVWGLYHTLCKKHLFSRSHHTSCPCVLFVVTQHGCSSSILSTRAANRNLKHYIIDH